MSYKKWERALRRALVHLSAVERDRTLEYYREMKEEKMLNGESEEAIVAEFGSPDACAEKILRANGVSPCRRNSPAEVVGLVFASLLLVLPLAAVLGSLVVSFAAISISGAAVSLAGVVFAIGSPFIAPSGVAIAAYVGMGIAATGAGFLLFVGFWYATKYGAIGLGALLRAIYVRR